MFWLEGGAGEICGEASVVVNVRLSRSIMSCSLVFTGAGGSGRTNALLGADVEVACAGGTVVLLALTIATLLLLPLEMLWEAVGCPLECLQSQKKLPIMNHTQYIHHLSSSFRKYRSTDYQFFDGD